MKITIDIEKNGHMGRVYKLASEDDAHAVEITSVDGTFEKNYAGEEIIQSSVQESYFYYVKIYSITEKQWLNHIENSNYMSDAVKLKMRDHYESARKRANLFYVVSVSVDMDADDLMNVIIDRMHDAFDKALREELAFALDEAIEEMEGKTCA